MILKKEGFIEVICGPMFSGKTTKLIEKVRLLIFSNFKFLVLKPEIDNRYSSKEELVTHNSKTIPCLMIKKSKDIFNFIEKDTSFLIIDEIQFFDKEIESILNHLSYKGLNIIVAGLELDFCGRPFGSMKYLLSIADEVLKLKSSCAICHKEANRTQRILKNKIPHWNDPVILIGGDEYHEPRCRKCHVFSKNEKNY
ncbi:thymidine kinase [Candidatus Phytoplasma pini]|uniref:Thymidine kinase n=1 Tax=Candidatus Phytoplasma pini TaxID=267362 RepID=A0A559KJ60_9MOLU|nr:thymidine kinase [Candidatus Phytoplasma pini]TVY12149.1 thymidine kinase [Candidatus Phytoplasma pini]